MERRRHQGGRTLFGPRGAPDRSRCTDARRRTVRGRWPTVCGWQGRKELRYVLANTISHVSEEFGTIHVQHRHRPPDGTGQRAVSLKTCSAAPLPAIDGGRQAHPVHGAVAPHFSEEMHARMGGTCSVFQRQWPTFDRRPRARPRRRWPCRSTAECAPLRWSSPCRARRSSRWRWPMQKVQAALEGAFGAEGHRGARPGGQYRGPIEARWRPYRTWLRRQSNGIWNQGRRLHRAIAGLLFGRSKDAATCRRKERGPPNAQVSGRNVAMLQRDLSSRVRASHREARRLCTAAATEFYQKHENVRAQSGSNGKIIMSFQVLRVRSFTHDRLPHAYRCERRWMHAGAP